MLTLGGGSVGAGLVERLDGGRELVRACPKCPDCRLVAAPQSPWLLVALLVAGAALLFAGLRTGLCLRHASAALKVATRRLTDDRSVMISAGARFGH